VSVGANLLFANGQNVTVAAIGNINIYKPVIVDWKPLYAGTPQVIISSGRLSLGNQSLAYPSMTFMHSIQSAFSGSVGYTQLISGEYDADLSYGTDGYELDNVEWYSSPNPVASTGSWSQNSVAFVDSPSIGLANINSATAMDLSYQTYLRFMPDAGPGPNIYVTLAVVNWGVTASATKSNGTWSVDPGSTYSGPTYTTSSTLPVWTESFSNTH
jgi:hypothetical protein